MFSHRGGHANAGIALRDVVVITLNFIQVFFKILFIICSRSDNVRLMVEIAVHIWKLGQSGFPSYLCGVKAEDVVASVGQGRVNLFPPELMCRACLHLHESQAASSAESPALTLNPLLVRGYVH